MNRLQLLSRISVAMQSGAATPQERAELQDAFTNSADGHLPADAEALLSRLEASRQA